MPATLQVVDLVLDNVSGAGPFTFRRTLTLGTRAATTPSPVGLGQPMTLSPGVALVFTQMAVERGTLTWQGTLRNDSSSIFNFRLSNADVHFQDNAGQPLNSEGSGAVQVTGRPAMWRRGRGPR